MDRHALIVGGARGIGRALGSALLDRGWQLTIAGRSSRAPELEERGASWRALDASDPAQVQSLSDLPPVHALVISAGSFHRRHLLDETPAAWRQSIQHNLDPAFFLGQALLPGMMERGWGRILTFGMAGASALDPSPQVLPHAIASAGVLALTRSLARVGASKGVTANCLALGFIDSGSEHAPDYQPPLPAGRQGKIEEVVATALFLLSDQASYINGVELPVTGAYSPKRTP